MSEPKSIHAAEDWGVVLQSVPSKNKKEIIKRLGEIFALEKRDAEQILSNMPLILVDNLSFGLAARIKKFFQTLGAVTETTNHDMIKKNCFQIAWPQTPDLSFFMKSETGPADAPVQEKKEKAKSGEVSSFWKRALGNGMKTEMPKPKEAPAPEKSVYEAPTHVSSEPPSLPKAEERLPATDTHIPQPSVKSAEEIAAKAEPSHSTPEVKARPASPSNVDSDWERRARELNEKLLKIQHEKQQLHVKHVEVAEKVKNDFQQQLEQEKQRNDEIAKAYEDLRVQAQQQEALTKEGEEWRTKAMALGEKIRELETNLTEKTSAIEQLIQQKNDLLSEQSQKASELAARVADLERAVAVREEEKSAIEGRVSDFEKNITMLQHELEGSRNREAEKASALEQLIRQKDDLHSEHSQKSDELAARVAELERTIAARDEEKSAIQGHVTDCENNITALQHELENSRNREREWSQKSGDLEHEVQQMTESLRSRDAVLAQFEQQILELAGKSQRYEALLHEHEQLMQERATIRQEYEVKLGEQEIRLAKVEEEHRRHRSRVDRKNAAATRELGEWIRGVDTIRQGLQKLILFLGSEAAVLDSEKKAALKSPLTRGPDSPNPENS